MIKEIQFENYRCFEKSKIKFKDMVVIVGKNNAGKSTLLEALRMIAYASSKAKTAVYNNIPAGLGVSIREKGFRIDVDKLKIDSRGVVFFYEDKIAKITALFEGGQKMVVLAKNDFAFALLYTSDDENIKNKRMANGYNWGNIGILPQIGLVKEYEKKYEKDTIVNFQDTYLTSKHFRNELLFYKKEYWESFKTLAEKSWEGLEIVSLDYNLAENENISLIVSDDRFVAEIGVMGSGLQMWLQIMWFICKKRNCDTIILDEPDVYMHPDLQRKLLFIIEKMYKQVIIATHSVEIISEVTPSSIVMIDKRNRRMKYADNLQAVQNIIENIGGVQNLSLIRIGLKKRCLFVEGKDIKILSKLYKIAYPEEENIFSNLPVIELHGFSNISEAFGTSNLFYQETNGEIKCICILDRDYFPSSFLEKKKSDAQKHHLTLHIWEKKELENYIIVPDALFRISKLPNNQYESFIKALNELVDEYKDEITDQIAQHIFEMDRSITANVYNSQARQIVNVNWTSIEKKLSLVSGKDLLKKINAWMKKKYGQHCSQDRIIREVHKNELSQEIMDIFDLLK